MNIQLLTNGNLEMSASLKTRKAIKKLVKQFENPASYDAERAFILMFLCPFGYQQVKPEDCGALTGAVIISDGKNFWGDMQYAVQSFLETLIAGGTVIWTRG